MGKLQMKNYKILPLMRECTGMFITASLEYLVKINNTLFTYLSSPTTFKMWEDNHKVFILEFIVAS